MQFFRYSAVGVCATLVHYAVLVALVEGHICSPAWGSAWGAIAGAQVAFFGNRWWTFAAVVPKPVLAPTPVQNRPTAAQPRLATSWLRFQLTALIAAALGVLWLKLGMYAGLHYLLAQVFATLTNLVLTFLVNRRWAFRGS